VGLLETLCRPAATLRQLDPLTPASVPWRTWTLLVLIAVGGSCTFGASLALQFPGWRPGAGAAWLALSAGLAWCLFGPALILLTRRSPWTLAHACLVTMAYGDGVLQLAAIGNVLGLARVLGGPTIFNSGMVLLSNCVMAYAVTAQLRSIGVAPWRTLTAWMLVLNGSGALFFALFYRVLGGLR
jgi:hypothetical protein